jgi:hypothetical protein
LKIDISGDAIIPTAPAGAEYLLTGVRWLTP